MKRLAVLLLLLLPGLAQARTVAIFNGSGTCQGCPQTVAALFRAAGDRVVYVDQHTLGAKTLGKVQVYVQPGGSDDIDETLDVLRPAQVAALRRFVAQGGHYLGICAGAYLAAQYSDKAAGRRAFGLVDIDELHAETADPAPSLLAIRWGATPRMVYNQSGPHLYRQPPAGARVLARYSATQRIAALSARFGRGQVLLIGPHLEADSSWYQEDGLSQQYGLNQDLFRQAIRTLK